MRRVLTSCVVAERRAPPEVMSMMMMMMMMLAGARHPQTERQQSTPSVGSHPAAGEQCPVTHHDRLSSLRAPATAADT